MNELEAGIEDIVQMIWSTLLGDPIEPSADVAWSDTPIVTGIVGIDGAWHGAVLVRCPLALAALITTSMLEGDDEPTFEEISDALGELTNMVAGNVKALLPQPCSISLPTVARGSQYEINVVGTTAVATIAFVSASHPLVVSVVQRRAGSHQP